MSTGRVFRLSAIGVVLCLFAFFAFSSQISLGDLKPFDQWKRPYQVSDVDLYLAWLDSDPSRWSALRAYRAIDMVFPLVVFLFVVSAVCLVWARGPVRRVAYTCAVVFLLADYGENITLSSLLSEDGAAFTAAQVARAGTFTVIKWISLVGALVLAVVGWIRMRRA